MKFLHDYWLFILIGLVLVFVRVILPELLRRRRKVPTDVYEKCGALLTPAERSFFGVLEGVATPQFRLFAKVRLADVVKVKGGMTNSERSAAFNSIRAKHLDFVACDPADLSIQFAIELDDSSHERESRKRRDSFVDDAMRQAGIPLFRFSAKRAYTPQEIHETLSAPQSSTSKSP